LSCFTVDSNFLTKVWNIWVTKLRLLSSGTKGSHPKSITIAN